MDDGTAPSAPVEQTLFDVEPEPPVTVVSEDVVVLREWGRDHNQAGPKPPTFRRVRRTTVTVATERWCSAGQHYVAIVDIRTGREYCRPCYGRLELAAQTPERRERMKWRAHKQRAEKLGVLDTVTYQDWVEVIDSTGGRCSVLGCGGPYERMDHILSYAAGGAHVPANLQPLCRPHHDEKTHYERAADGSRLWSSDAGEVA